MKKDFVTRQATALQLTTNLVIFCPWYFKGVSPHYSGTTNTYNGGGLTGRRNVRLEVLHVFDGHLDDFGLLDSAPAFFHILGRYEP